jgi:thiamine biosynthesis protein ThiS
MITLTVNGRPREVDAPIGLVDFLVANDIDPERVRVAVAYNGEVLRREEYSQVILKNGDSLEIVRMVGGG